jgi:hypothetical protein
VERNFAGLCRQYGAYGLMELLKRNPSHRRYNHWFREIQEGRWPLA